MRELAVIAREAVKAELFGKHYSPPKTKWDKLMSGVFVTITINNALRGCIGFIKPMPVVKGVINAAINAAFNDPRFPPLTIDEFSKASFEVSLLSTPKPAGINDVKRGVGVILHCCGRSALFLPQVWEELPDKGSFLRELCFKAGLSSDCFKKASFEVFTVKSFVLMPDE